MNSRKAVEGSLAERHNSKCVVSNSTFDLRDAGHKALPLLGNAMPGLRRVALGQTGHHHRLPVLETRGQGHVAIEVPLELVETAAPAFAVPVPRGLVEEL